MKLLLHLIQILIGIYWAGAVARENKTVDKLIKVIEGGYSEFNDKLKSTSLDNGLSKLQSFYGWSSIPTLSGYLRKIFDIYLLQ